LLNVTAESHQISWYKYAALERFQLWHRCQPISLFLRTIDKCRRPTTGIKPAVQTLCPNTCWKYTQWNHRKNAQHFVYIDYMLTQSQHLLKLNNISTSIKDMPLIPRRCSIGESNEIQPVKMASTISTAVPLAWCIHYRQIFLPHCISTIF